MLVRPDGIFVDVKNGSLGPNFRAATTAGGSDTSLENNNVYAVEPRMYVQGADGEEIAVEDGVDSQAAEKMDPGTLAISIAGVAALALGGSATCVFYENYVALGLFWLVGFGLAAQKSLEVTARSKRTSEAFYNTRGDERSADELAAAREKPAYRENRERDTHTHRRETHAYVMRAACLTTI